mgnify:CR=1 FL=1
METSKRDNWSETTFLASVAKDLMVRFGKDMTKVAVVFPNKRARLFMNEEFLALTDTPMWAPQYATIGELFGRITGDNVMEPIPAVCTLYNIYKVLMGDKAESLDMFWGWGEIMLSDFDDIDKHLVNADALFLNAKELGDMESLDFLTDNQREALEQFFGSFQTEHRTRLQERFSELWSIMPQLYHQLKDTMPEGTQPYQGALERKAVEDKEMLHLLDDDTMYCFVGFNMLSETEKKLMSYLHDRGRALFYWDFDVMYMENRAFEAGDFIRENLLRFPNALARAGIYNNLRHKGEVTFISTSTDSSATRYIPEWLKEHLTLEERETALVLCDEQQLQPVLHAIPDNEADTEEGKEEEKEEEKKEGTPSDVNITMGYSLTGTPIHSLMLALIALQTEGWDEGRKRFRLPFLRTVKYHPYFKYMEDVRWEERIDSSDIPALVAYLLGIVSSLAGKMQDENLFDDVLMVESLFQTHRTLRQFHDIATETQPALQLNPTTLRRLLRRILGSQSIPFHGEPAQGLQIMGVLETRCLDFRNLLMLNVGEGFLPKSGADNSLIPYTLRVGFGLTTVRHRIAVFAYYFYRLIQRAEHVTFIYNENSSGNVRHEMSRFLRQLQAETDIPIRCLRLEAEQECMFTSLDTIPKDDAIMQALHEKYDLNTNPEARPLSPSSINRYLDCPMKFYLSSVCGIRVEPDPEDGIDARLMGTIFHNSAERVYKEIMSHTGSNVITREHLSAYTTDKGSRLQKIIDEQFLADAGITEFRGENILIRGVVERYLMNLLRWDECHAPITMEAMEEDVNMQMDVDVDGQRVSVLTGGRVDRIDEMGGRRRIVDYKTGTFKPEESVTMKKVMSSYESIAGYYRQLFIYSLAEAQKKETTMPIQPILFYPSQAADRKYEPSLNIAKKDIDDFATQHGEEFREGLQSIIADIFDPEKPFICNGNENSCKYCKLSMICGKKNY